MDEQTTVSALRSIVAEFVAEREWEPFHSPKNLAMSLAIEAAELMEHFQWISMDESRSLADDPGRRTAIADEISDVLCYLLGLANVLDLDLSESLRNKMQRNRDKYPVDRFRGTFQ